MRASGEIGMLRKAGHGKQNAPHGRLTPLQSPLDAENSFTRRALGTCALGLVLGFALLAFWELGNFGLLIGNGPLLPPAANETPLFRPAVGPEETNAGCTQAPIDRKTGITAPADCHT